MSIAALKEADDILLRRDHGGGIVELTMNRPDAFNSLSSSLMARMQDAFDELAQDKDARVIVLSGSGRGFCAGHDLKEVRSLTSPDERRALMAQCCRLMSTIVRHPRPVIARVHGVATAAGCQLVASCDLAIAESSARFATPGVNIGLFCSTPMVALGRNVSRKHAMEMLLTGELMDASTAERFGLINRAVEPTELDTTVRELATRIASKSTYTIRIGKEAFYAQLEMPLDDAYAYAAEVMVENMMAHDADEGIAAFVEKRTPQWQDR